MLHPAPAGVVVPVDATVAVVPVLAVGSVVPVPVLTCCKQARRGKATRAESGARADGDTAHAPKEAQLRARGANSRRMRYRPRRMPESPFAVASRHALAGHDSALASAALGRLAGILGEDAIFVLGSGARDAKDALDGVLQRRGPRTRPPCRGSPTRG